MDSLVSLANVKFGNNLRRFESGGFFHCRSLERITIPLRDGFLIDADSIFHGCANLKHVDLAERVALHEALHLEERRKDMNREIISIDRILLNVPKIESRRKGQAIGGWARSILHKINHYNAEHRRILDETPACFAS